MKTSIILATAVIGFAAQTAFAQDAVPPNDWIGAASAGPAATAVPGTARAQVRERIGANAHSPFADSSSRGSQHRAFAGTLSRAEVLADLEVYRASGLAALEGGETVAFHAPEYQRAQARYAELRSSPSFTALVRSIDGSLQVAGR